MKQPGISQDFRTAEGRTFLHLLLNTLLVSVLNFTLWFALTFWVFLETHSVFATGMIGGIFVAATALTGIWFGVLVDRHHKKKVMQGSAAVSFCLYALCLGIYLLTPESSFRDPSSPVLWLFVIILMLGVITGNLRSIALPTLVTLLIPEDRRDRANGLVGTTSGVSFLVTSVISGLLVAWNGMLGALLLALVALLAALVHVAFVRVDEHRVVHADASTGGVGGVLDDNGTIDIPGTVRLVRSVPGLFSLIIFSCFNNFLGGVFMALTDPYGLSLVSVQTWGLLLGVMGTAFILGGLAVAKTGLSDNPIKVLLIANLLLWSIAVLFPMRSSIVLLTVGMYVYMLLIPYAEAAEQTVLQKVVPYQRQGRVFGFAQSVEQAASPLTAFLIGPLTQFLFIPLMTDGVGARTIGSWFGTGPDRGMALVFIIAGVIGLVVTALALRSRSYRLLSQRYREPAAQVSAGAAIS